MPKFNPEFRLPEPSPEASFQSVQKDVGLALLALDDARRSFEGVAKELENFSVDEPGKAELEEANARLLRRLDQEEKDLVSLLAKAQNLTV